MDRRAWSRSLVTAHVSGVTHAPKMAQVGEESEDCSDALQPLPDNADEGQDVTPLPWGQLLIVLLIQIAEPITGMVIFPFINQFVGETGVTGGDETRTGYFAGIIVRTWLCNHVLLTFDTTFQESMFFLAEATTVVFWGMASDRFGRRSILIFGPLGLSITMLGFGASTQFCSLVMFRFFQGVFNGNMGLSLCRYHQWLLTPCLIRCLKSCGRRGECSGLIVITI